MYDTETLRAAFAFATIRDIIVADERLTRGEMGFYEQVDRRLREVGLLEADGTLTPGYHDALAQADRRLRDELDRDSKLALIGLFHQASKVDQGIDPREGEIIQHATQVLGLEREDVLDYLTAQYVGGS